VNFRVNGDAGRPVNGPRSRADDSLIKQAAVSVCTGVLLIPAIFATRYRSRYRRSCGFRGAFLRLRPAPAHINNKEHKHDAQGVTR